MIGMRLCTSRATGLISTLIRLYRSSRSCNLTLSACFGSPLLLHVTLLPCFSYTASFYGYTDFD